jgi:hypothetical protein
MKRLWWYRKTKRCRGTKAELVAVTLRDNKFHSPSAYNSTSSSHFNPSKYFLRSITSSCSGYFYYVNVFTSQPCSAVEICRRFGRKYFVPLQDRRASIANRKSTSSLTLLFEPADARITFLQKISILLRDYTAPYLRRHSSHICIFIIFCIYVQTYGNVQLESRYQATANEN